MATPAVTPQPTPQADPVQQALDALPLDTNTKANLWDGMDALRKANNDDVLNREGIVKLIDPLNISQDQKANLYDALYSTLPAQRNTSGAPDVRTGNAFGSQPLATKIASPTGSLAQIGEDMTYGSVGAGLGAAAGTAVAGPEGAIPGGMIGAMGGRAIEKGVRSLTGRGNLNPQTPGADAVDTAMAGAGGAFQGAGKAATEAGEELTPLVEKARDFGIPLSPGQRYGGGLQYMEAYLRKAAGSADIMESRFTQPQNSALIDSLNEIIDRVSKSSFKDQAQAGQQISEAIDTAKNFAGNVYQSALSKIKATGADQFSVELDSDLQAKAQQLLDRLQRGDDFGSVSSAGREKAIQVVSEFANPTKQGTVTGASQLDPQGNPILQQIPATVGKTLTVGDAIKLKQDLDSLINWDEMSGHQEALSELRFQLNNEIQKALPPSIRGQWVAANNQYSALQEKLEQTAIKGLIDNDQPELVADRLLRGGAAQSNANTLRSIIGASRMNVVKGSVLDKMMTNAFDAKAQDPTIVGPTLLQQWNRLGPEAQHAIFNNPQQEQDITRFVQMAAQLQPKEISNGLVNMTQTGAFGASLYGLAKNLITMNPHGVELSASGLASVYMAPRTLAMLLSSPKGASLLAKAASTPVGSKAAGYIGAELAYAMFNLSPSDSSTQQTPQTPRTPAAPASKGNTP